MKKEWAKVIPQMVGDLSKVDQIKCPNCGKCEIDYLYVGDGNTRIGFLQVWCNKCLKGIYVSRATAPSHAKFVTFETDLESIIPKIKFV